MKKFFAIIVLVSVAASSGCTVAYRNEGKLIADYEGQQVCTPAVFKPDVVGESGQTVIGGEEYSCWGCLDEEPYKFYPQFCCIQVTAKTCPDEPHVWCTNRQHPSWKKGKCWE